MNLEKAPFPNATPVAYTIERAATVIDEEAGIVEYIASDESRDFYNEVILARGWKFDNFKKNSPFVDSHNYGSIDAVLGKVIDWRIDREKKQLINRVQWAIDVESNELARKGWEMTRAGYLCAVSIGAWSVERVTRWGQPAAWQREIKKLGYEESDAPDVVHLKMQQTELSAVVLGANPNAVAKGYKDGILDDSDLSAAEKQFQAMQRNAASHRAAQQSALAQEEAKARRLRRVLDAIQ